MKLLNNQFYLLLIAGVIGFSACNDDEEASTMTVNSITTTDGTNLFGATSASGVALDQNILIGFSASVNSATLGNVGLFNGSNEVDAAVTASGSTVTITPAEDLFGGGLYTVRIEGVQSTDGTAASTVEANFTTRGIGLGTAPASSNQIMYVQFNTNYVDLTGNSSMTHSQNSWVADRFGNVDGALYLNGANSGPGSGDIVEYDGDFISPSLTLSAWFKVDPANFPGSRPAFGVAAEKGYFLEVGGNIDWMKFTSSHKISPDPNLNYFGASDTDPNGDGNESGITIQDYTGSINALTTGENDGWAHFVMTYDVTTSLKTIYVNGIQAMQQNLSLLPPGAQLTDLALRDRVVVTGNPIENIEAKLAFGFFASRNNGPFDSWNNYSLAENTFVGAIDDFRLWDVSLSTSQVEALYQAEKP